MYKIVGTVVALSLSMAGRIAMMQYARPPAMPQIPIAIPGGMAVPGGTALPQLQPMALPFAIPGQPGLSFPSPSTILGSGPAPAPGRPTTRRDAARSGVKTPYSPAKSLRGTARVAPGPAARPRDVVRGVYAPAGR